jgi:MFS family permease
MLEDNIVRTGPAAPVPAAAPSEDSPEFRAKGRRALGAAMFGFFVDMYDVYLPVIALAPAIVYFSSAGSTAVDMAVFTALIFVASIIGRPLGSLIFGPLGDRLGRRKTTLICAAGITVSTGLMAVLPGYSTIGVWALVSLVVLRLVAGVFLGGEYTAANPLAMEYTPRHRRGVAGSLINMGYPLALAFITVVTLVTLQFFPAGGPDSAYAVWGWRIPFAVGFVICSALFYYYLTSVPESELWTKMPKAQGNPLRNLFAGSNARSFAVAFVVGTGAWLTLNGTIGVFATHFRGMGVPDGRINTVILISALLGAAMFPLVGAAGQRFGRRQVIMVIGAACALVGAATFALAVAESETLSMVPFAVAAIVPGLWIWAMITAFLMELFPTSVRASGYGVAYSLPSVIPAFYAYYMVWMSGLMDYAYTPVVIIAAGGVLLVVGGYVAKDRRHMDLGEV